MCVVAAEVLENADVCTSGIFQSVCQDGKASRFESAGRGVLSSRAA